MNSEEFWQRWKAIPNITAAMLGLVIFLSPLGSTIDKGLAAALIILGFGNAVAALERSINE